MSTLNNKTMKHKISIANLKHMPSLSEETYCFTCTVLINGKKTWLAKNTGHGASTQLDWLKPVTERGDEKHDTDAIIDIVEKSVHETIMLRQFEKDKKAVANKLKKSLFFRIKGQKAGSYYHIRVDNPYDAAVREKALSKGKGEVETIINDLPIDEAIKYFYKYDV
jgi:hypothetical protein